MREFVARAACVALIIAFGIPSPAEAAEVKLICAHDQPTTPGSQGERDIAWQTFKKDVEARTKGRVEVQVIGAGQLGDILKSSRT